MSISRKLPSPPPVHLTGSALAAAHRRFEFLRRQKAEFEQQLQAEIEKVHTSTQSPRQAIRDHLANLRAHINLTAFQTARSRYQSVTGPNPLGK